MGRAVIFVFAAASSITGTMRLFVTAGEGRVKDADSGSKTVCLVILAVASCRV
jgi:hypothetical protein